MRSYRRLIVAAAIFVCRAGCSLAGTNDAPTPTAEILLGMSAPLTIPSLRDDATSLREGVVAGLDAANRAGGVHGRHLRLIALDDGYEPARTVPNLRQLLQQDNVLAIIEDYGTPTALAGIPICDEQHTVYFAGLSGAGALRRNPPDRYVINYRASFSEEINAMIDALIDGAGLQPQDIAFFTQRDSFGDSGYEAGIAALKRHGLTDVSRVMRVSYERNTLEVENAVASLLYAEHQPRVVVMLATYIQSAKFIKLAYAAGARWVFPFVVGNESLAESLGDVPADVIATQIVPSPLATDLPIVREYQADLKALNPSDKPRIVGLEGYVASRIFLKSLEQIPGTPTREGIINAMEGLGDFDLGLGVKLHLGTDEHQACHHIWPTILRDGHFVPFDWKDIGILLRNNAP
jgi:ABC-type branched-subunit amino acid transport system substrate-binding protein